jgi:P2-related tail formation protein
VTERLHLLPQNATPLERAVSETVDRQPELAVGAEDLRGFKFDLSNETIVPWLVVEYGLGPITPYLPNLPTAIEYGLRWNKVKGTPQGIREALSWVGYAFDELYEAPTRRTRWHLFELGLDRFWDHEADLPTIEAVVRLSEPVRSEFRRGYHGYNVRGHEWGYSRWGHSIWGDSSGARLTPGGAKWSFGRTFEPPGGSYGFTEAQLTGLGVWIPPVGGGGLTWGPFTWETPGFTWQSGGAAARATAIASGLLAKTFWVRLRRQDGSLIGARKARAVHSVSLVFQGRYQVGDASYEPTTPGALIYVDALTGFGDADTETVGSWELVIGGALPPGSKPGVRWLPGNTLVGGTVVGGFTLAPLPTLGKTDRERFRGIFRID